MLNCLPGRRSVVSGLYRTPNTIHFITQSLNHPLSAVTLNPSRTTRSRADGASLSVSSCRAEQLYARCTITSSNVPGRAPGRVKLLTSIVSLLTTYKKEPRRAPSCKINYICLVGCRRLNTLPPGHPCAIRRPLCIRRSRRHSGWPGSRRSRPFRSARHGHAS